MFGLTELWMIALAGSLLSMAPGGGLTVGDAVRPGPDPSTIDAAITGLYAAISGPVGQERDWEAFHALMAPDARMGAFAADAEGNARYVELTPQQYQERSGPWLVEHGFTESETHRILEVYGSVAHAWSTYKGVYDDPNTEGGKGTMEGINSIQLVHLDGRWRVVSIRWESTQTAGAIPAKYGGE